MGGVGRAVELEQQPRLLVVASPTNVPLSIRRAYPVQVTFYDTDQHGSSWNLTEQEARDLRAALDRFLTPASTPEEGQR